MQEVGREAWGVWEALEGVGGSFDQNILSTCMKLSEKKDCDLKGVVSFSEGNMVSREIAAPREKAEEIEAGLGDWCL